MHRRALLTVAGTTLVAGCATRFGDRTGPTSEPEPSDPRSTPDDADRAGPESETRTEPISEPEPSVTVVEDELVRESVGSASELATVVGTVRNDGDPVGVRLVAAFSDDDGSVVKTGRLELDSLRSGGTWVFELRFPGSGAAARAVADYRLAVETDAAGGSA